MLLDVLDRPSTLRENLPPTAPLGEPTFFRPTLEHLSEFPATETGWCRGTSEADGIRILDGIAPLQHEKFYLHSLSSRLEVLQSWEGAVVAIDQAQDTFTARLYDLTNASSDVSEAEFEVRDVSSNDIDLLRIGGVFRWMIGYRRHSYGQRERVSAIVFRRLPAWNQEDIQKAVAEGERLAAKLRIR